LARTFWNFFFQKLKVKKTSIMRLFFCAILLTINSLSPVFAQSVKQFERAGEKAFDEKDYNAAVFYYAYVLSKDPKNLEVLYKYADCARKFFAFPIAEKSYLKIATSKRKKDFPMLDFRLGEVKKAQGDYAAAKQYFKNFTLDGGLKSEPEFTKRALSEADNCDWAMQRMAETDQTEVKPLGREINSTYSDFGANLRGDTLLFSSYRFEIDKSNKKPKPRTTKILMSIGGAKAKQIGRGFPADDSTHVAHAVFSSNGRRIYFNFCKNVGPAEIRCEVWFLEKDKKGKFQKPRRLLNSVNQPNTTATQPNLFFDKKTQREQLLFASNRTGGVGNLDIYQVALDSASGQPVGEPQNLKLLNTTENDGTPFFFVPDETLWFASEGWQGLGGWDIYSSKKDDLGAWTTPKHAASPLNTSYNDLYFSLKKDGKTGFLASNRPGSLFLDATNKACCNDIFSVKFPVPPSPTKTPPVANVPTNPEIMPLPPVPTTPETPREPVFVPKKLEDFAGLPLYFDNDEPDKRTRKTTTKKTYEETFWPYFEQSETYRTEFSSNLTGEKTIAAQNEVDDFFENEVKKGFDRLFLLTDFLLVRLQDGERVEIFIKGFTSPRAEKEYNIALGRRRISSIRNHFEKFGDGIFAPYFRSGMLKITETSFGETTAKTNISDKLEDRRGSIYNPNAARERRVEIVEIKSQ
jgi:hypothetical protein